jgi:hypothetical protein
LTWTYLVALLFETKGRSPTRRIVQLSVFFCYFYSALQKILCPDFMLGYSMQAEMSEGWAFNGIFKSILPASHLPMIFWQLSAWMTVIAEAYLAFALFSKKQRKWALAIGTAFHIGIAALLDFYISLFSLAMITAYVAFIDRRSDAAQFPEPAQGKVPGTTLQHACAVAFVLLLALVPLRIYAFPDRPLDSILMFDRTPWTFCMFLQRILTDKISVRYQTADSAWHEIGLEKTWRTNSAKSDSEMYSICNWVLHNHPEAQAVDVQLINSVNGRYKQHRSLSATRQRVGALQVVNE